MPPRQVLLLKAAFNESSTVEQFRSTTEVQGIFQVKERVIFSKASSSSIETEPTLPAVKIESCSHLGSVSITN